MSDLSPDDKAVIAGLLRDTIAADRFPLSPRIKRMRAILNKLDPPVPKPAPLPPLKPPGEHGCRADARYEVAAMSGGSR